MAYRKTGIKDAGAIRMNLPSKFDQPNGADCHGPEMCKTGNCLDLDNLRGDAICVGSKKDPECNVDVIKALVCHVNCDPISAEKVSWVTVCMCVCVCVWAGRGRGNGAAALNYGLSATPNS